MRHARPNWPDGSAGLQRQDLEAYGKPSFTELQRHAPLLGRHPVQQDRRGRRKRFERLQPAGRIPRLVYLPPCRGLSDARRSPRMWLGRGGEAALDLTEIRTRAGAAAFRERTPSKMSSTNGPASSSSKSSPQQTGAHRLHDSQTRQRRLFARNIGTKNQTGITTDAFTNNIYFNTEDGTPSNFAYSDGGNNVQIYRMSPYHIYWPIPKRLSTTIRWRRSTRTTATSATRRTSSRSDRRRTPNRRSPGGAGAHRFRLALKLQFHNMIRNLICTIALLAAALVRRPRQHGK